MGAALGVVMNLPSKSGHKTSGPKSAWRRTGAEMVPNGLGSLTISLTEANTSEKGSSGSKVKCTSLPEGKVRRFEESQVLHDMFVEGAVVDRSLNQACPT